MTNIPRCKSFSLIFSLSMILCTSCSLIPIQAGRMDAVFNYTQTYELGSIGKYDPEGRRLLTAALGENNFCQIKEDIRKKYLSSLFNENRWRADGLATVIISPSPWRTDGFVIEANGRYLIRDDDTLIATSEFYIAKQSVDDIKALFDDRRTSRDGDDRDLRWIDLLIRQIVVPTSSEQRYVHQSELVVRMYIIPLDSRGVFAIAPVRHEIGIMSQREPNSVYSVGCVDFDEPRDGRKVFDVRGRDSMFRVKDYADILRRAGIRQQSNAFAPKWYGEPCAANERRAPYQASARRSASEWIPDRDGEHFKRLFEEPQEPCPKPTSPGAPATRTGRRALPARGRPAGGSGPRGLGS